MASILSAAAALLAFGAAACGPDDAGTQAAVPANDSAAAANATIAVASGTKNEDPRAATRGVEDPRAFIAAQYAAFERDPNAPRPSSDLYSDRLRALSDAHEAWTAQHDGLVGALDFDWWTNSQDWVLSDIRVSEASADADRRIVVANFTNGDRPDAIRFVFVRQGDRWLLDDAIEGSGTGSDGWTLSDLLRNRDE